MTAVTTTTTTTTSMERSLDPRTGEVVGDAGPETLVDDVTTICAAASAAASTFADSATSSRAQLLDAMADGLEAARPDLVAAADQETALVDTRLNGELTRTVFQLRFFADVVRRGRFLDVSIDHARETAMGPAPDLRRMRVPLGPVAVFAASNFPFAFSVPGGDTAAALGAGCPVVIKAHPSHPATSRATFAVLHHAVTAAGLPDAVLSMVHGMEAGRALAADPHIRAVAFTGSQRGGRALFDLTAARNDPIPFYGELGSLNPLVVAPSAAAARGEQIATDWVASFTLGVGQFCTKPGLALVPSGSVADTMHEAAADAVAASAPGVMLNATMPDAFRAGHTRAADLAEMTVRAPGEDSDDGGYRVVPTLHRIAARDLLGPASSLLEENFGPGAVLAEYDDLAEVRAVVRAVGGSLTATLHADADDADFASAVLPELAELAGRVVWNGFPTGVAVSPSMQHGGPWPSSTSSLHTSVGAAAIDRFLRPVTFQSVPAPHLPLAVRDDNPLGVPQRVDGVGEPARRS